MFHVEHFATKLQLEVLWKVTRKWRIFSGAFRNGRTLEALVEGNRQKAWRKLAARLVF
jgi:hypothetical protein